MKIMIFILMAMFSFNVGSQISGFELFTGTQISGESLYLQVKKLMKKLKKALKKEKLFKRSDFNRLQRLIQGGNIDLALKIVNDYELKASRNGNVYKIALRLKTRLNAVSSQNGVGQLLQPEEEDCPGSGMAQTEFFSTERAFAALQPSGLIVTWGADSFGGDSGEVADEISCGVIKVFSTQQAFAALKTDGSVVTWGDAAYGGDSSLVSSMLGSGVRDIFATQRAFAALKEDGSVVVWGNRLYGGEAAIMRAFYVGREEQWEADPLPVSLLDGSQGRVTRIVPSASAFVAIMEDKQDPTEKSVFAWGNHFMGGDLVIHDVTDAENGFYDQYVNYNGYVREGFPVMKEISPLLESGVVTDIFSTDGAFAALKDNGSVVTWGAGKNFFKNFPAQAYGGNSNSVELQNGVTNIFSNSAAFAALKSDHSVITWGDIDQGGDSRKVSGDLAGGVVDIVSNDAGFAAIKNDGSVVIWGGDNNRKFDSSLGAPVDVTGIVASAQSFAALQRDGSVNSWGEIIMQSDHKELLAGGVVAIFANDDAFAALKDNGAVVTWGWESAGGEMPSAYSDYLDAWFELERAEYEAGRIPNQEEIKAQVIHHLYRVKDSVVKIASTKAAFVALKRDGSIVTWGDSNYGGDSSGVSSLFGTNSN